MLNILKKWYIVFMKFRGPKSHIHFIARGLLMRKENIILCRVKGADWFFLPGGHIEDGESAKTALLRELKEEIGKGDYNITNFVGAYENVFSLNERVLQHEMNIIFAVNIPKDYKIKTKETHIEFVSTPKNSLKNYKILPPSLRDRIIEWLISNRPFFEGSGTS